MGPTWPTAMVGAPQSKRAEKPKALLVLLHGYGDSGRGFIDIGEALQSALPDVVIVAPDALQPFEGGGDGRQWYSIRKATDETRAHHIAVAAEALTPWIKTQLVRWGLTPGDLMVLGFSQGAMVANTLALTLDPPPRATVSVGGLFAAPPSVRSSKRPKVLVLHGEADLRVPTALGEAAARELRARGADVELTTFPGLGHGFDPRVLAAASKALVSGLSSPAPTSSPSSSPSSAGAGPSPKVPSAAWKAGLRTLDKTHPATPLPATP